MTIDDSSADKLNISDTAAMLSGLLKISDTAAMLVPYYRTQTAATDLALKENVANKSTSTSLGTSREKSPALVANEVTEHENRCIRLSISGNHNKKQLVICPRKRFTCNTPTPRRSRESALVGQLTIGLQTRMAAPEPANRRRRACSRRRRRLPFQTKGVGSAFQPATVCSNHSMTC